MFWPLALSVSFSGTKVSNDNQITCKDVDGSFFVLPLVPDVTASWASGWAVRIPEVSPGVSMMTLM